MREIKFRAWFNNKMDYMPHGWNEYFGETMPINEAIQQAIEDGQTLMQYTGLKDKNGKEIYEGDIVKSYNIISYVDASINHIIGTVKYIKSCFIVDHKYNAILNNDCEVIGNIYENPDLL